MTVDETISRVVVAVLSADWKAASVPVVICGMFMLSVPAGSAIFVTRSAVTLAALANSAYSLIK